MKKDPLVGEAAELVDEIGRVGQLLYGKGWAESNAGNISVRLDQPVSRWWEGEEFRIRRKIKLSRGYPEVSEKFFIVKGSGKRMRDIIVDPKQNLCIGFVEEKEFKIIWPLDCSFDPTSELNSHLAIQEYNSAHNKKRKAVLHTHADELIALSLLSWIKDTKSLNEVLWRVIPETSIFVPEGVGFVPFEVPSSEELAEKTAKMIEKHNLILWEKHGILCTGPSLTVCFDLIDIVNKAAKIYLLTRPDAINMLTDQQLAAIEDHFRNIIKNAKKNSKRRWE